MLQGCSNSFRNCLFFLKTYHDTLYMSLNSKHLFIFKWTGGHQSAVASVLQAEIQNAIVFSLCSLHLDHETFVFPAHLVLFLDCFAICFSSICFLSFPEQKLLQSASLRQPDSSALLLVTSSPRRILHFFLTCERVSESEGCRLYPDLLTLPSFIQVRGVIRVPLSQLCHCVPSLSLFFCVLAA